MSDRNFFLSATLDLDTANDYYDQNQIKDIAKGGLVTETTFNLDSPATLNNQYLILVRISKKKSRSGKTLLLAGPNV
jgi:hypothetical protein